MLILSFFLLRVCSYDFVTSTSFVIHILFFAGTWAIQIYLAVLFLNLDILNTCNICKNHISLAVTSLVDMPISVPVFFPFFFFVFIKYILFFYFSECGLNMLVKVFIIRLRLRKISQLFYLHQEPIRLELLFSFP